VSFRLFTTLAVVVGFALTVAISLWHQGAEEEPHASRAIAAAPVAPVRVAQAAAPAPASVAAVAPRPQGLTAWQTSAAPAAADSGPAGNTRIADPDAPPREDIEVPVAVRVRSHGQAAPTVTLLNRSADLLHLSIVAQNPSTGQQSQADVTLDAHETKELTDSNLVIEPGDQIRVQGPPYRDLMVYQ